MLQDQLQHVGFYYGKISDEKIVRTRKKVL